MDEFFLEIGCRSWSQKLSPLCRCTKCSMLSVLSLNPPGIKLFWTKAHVGTFKEGTAFLGSDLGLRVLETNLGHFKAEWKVLGPWSLDFCMVSTLSIKNEMCARRSMLTTSLGAEPHNHHSSRRVAAVVLILLDLGLEALESNNFTEKRSVGKFGSLSFGFPNSPRFVG